MAAAFSARKTRFKLRHIVLLVFVVSVGLVLCGCETARYYSQAARGHLRIVARQQPLDKLIRAPDTPGNLKERFQLVLRLRAFAEKELKLQANGHYLKYADLGRAYVVWNVYAAREFSVEDHTWWYPFVGRLSYRGYFQEADAQRYASLLRAKGLDVYVGGVEAYSTLGWFRDPLLNTFIHHREAALAELIFHELAHQRLFISGDTDFNEAFATAVAEEGVRRWLTASNQPELLDAWRARQRRQREFTALILKARTELQALYQKPNDVLASAATEPTAPTKRERKAAIIHALRQDYVALKQSWGSYSGYDPWIAQPINNAQLNTVATYHELVPAFEEMLARQAGDMEKLYAGVGDLSRLKKTDRHRRLKEIATEGQTPQRQPPNSMR